MPDNAPPEDAAELGRAYVDVLGRQGWEIDVEPPADLPVETVSTIEAAPIENDSPAAAPEPLAPRRIVEAMLFIGGVPLTTERACEAIRGLTPAQFTLLIEELEHDYRSQGRPYYVRLHEGGYSLELRPRFRAVAERLSGGVREVRLSPLAVDALSLVAYRQPVTKQEVDTLRGADSGSLLRQLVRHGLIGVAPRAEAAGEAAYVTTQQFLEMFGLKDLDDLPQTQDLEKL